MKQEIKLIVNKEPRELEVDVHRTLLEVLRDELHLTGTKHGCGNGECGACTVLVEGKPILSCITLAVSVDGKEITTIEGLANGDQLHPLQESFVRNHGLACGYCTPGIILSAKALLDRKQEPTEDEVREVVSDHLCRCGTYPKVIQSVMEVVKTKE